MKELSIESVAAEMEQWRKSRRSQRERIPEKLIEDIVSLVSSHSRTELRRRLSLSSGFFSQHVLRRPSKKPATTTEAPFVALPKSLPQAPSLSTMIRMEVELPNGVRLRFF